MKIILSLATILLAACAGTPPATNSQAIEPDPTHESGSSDTQTAADRRFAEETRGYKLIEKNGKKYYCRSERASGSNLKSQVCWTETELRQRVDAAEAYRRKYKPSVCAPKDPRCSGA